MTMSPPRVGAPVVRQTVFGDWLVDDGSLVPQRASDRPAAFDEAAARSSISPPAGGPVASRFDADGSVAATPGVARLLDSQPSRGAVGQAPGPSDASPRNSGLGVSNSFAGLHGAVPTEDVGVAASEAVATPIDPSSPPPPNGAST